MQVSSTGSYMRKKVLKRAHGSENVYNHTENNGQKFQQNRQGGNGSW